MGHKKGKRKRERVLRERVVVERALGIHRKGFCPICGEKCVRLSPDKHKDVFYAVSSGRCPRCGSRLKVTKDDVLYCSRRPVCKWCVYVEGLGRR